MEWLDAAPLPVLVLVAHQPLDRARDGAAAEGLPRALPDELERPVEREEDVLRGDQLARAREAEVGARGGREPELVQRRLGRRADGRPGPGEQGEARHGART